MKTYFGLSILDKINQDKNNGEYWSESAQAFLPLFRPADIVNHRIETPTMLDGSTLSRNERGLPKNSSGALGGSWLTNYATLLNLPTTPIGTTHFFQSAVANESIEWQIVAENVAIEGIQISSGGTAHIYIDGVDQGISSWAGTPTSVLIAGFESGEMSANTNSSYDSTNFTQGLRSISQSQSVNTSTIAVATYTTAKDLSAIPDNAYILMDVKVDVPANLTYFQFYLDSSTNLTAYATVQFAGLIGTSFQTIYIRKSQLQQQLNTGDAVLDWSSVKRFAFRFRTNTGGAVVGKVDNVRYVVPSTIFSKTGMDPLIMPGHKLEIKAVGDGIINIGAIVMDASQRAIEMHNVKRSTPLGLVMDGILNNNPTSIHRGKATMQTMIQLQITDITGVNRALTGSNSYGSIETATTTDPIYPGQRIVTDNQFAGIPFYLAHLALRQSGNITPTEETQYLDFERKQMNYFILQNYGEQYHNTANNDLGFGALMQLGYILLKDPILKERSQGIVNQTFSYQFVKKWHNVFGDFSQVVDDSLSKAIGVTLNEHDGNSPLSAPILATDTVIPITSYSDMLINNGDTEKWVVIDDPINGSEIVRLVNQVSAGSQSWNVRRGQLKTIPAAHAAGVIVYRTFDVGYSVVQQIMAATYAMVSGDLLWLRIAKTLFNVMQPLINMSNGYYDNSGGSRQNTPSQLYDFGLGMLEVQSKVDEVAYPNQNFLDVVLSALEENVDIYGTLNVPGSAASFIEGDQLRESSFAVGIGNALIYLGYVPESNYITTFACDGETEKW